MKEAVIVSAVRTEGAVRMIDGCLIENRFESIRLTI